MPEPTPLDPARFRATVGGQTVALYTLRNRHGMAAAITNHGARIEQLLAPDRDGRLGDVVLGHDSIEQVLAGQASMGAFIARFAGRIAQGRFALDGQAHQLSRNDGPHHLHGGTNGSRFRVFEARQTCASSVEMALVFADGEDGYPGTLSLRVRYCVTDDNALVIDYAGLAADRPTIANFTSHAFFNLSGEGGSSILDHVLTVHADRFLEVDAAAIPTGRIDRVVGTPLDFRRPTPIGARIDHAHEQLMKVGGYDHTLVLRAGEPGEPGAPRHAATLHHPGSGRVMAVWSTEPALQLYSGNHLQGIGKGGAVYRPRTGVCLEPQGYPDAPNHPHFPSAVLRPGQWRRGRIVYRFSSLPVRL